MNKNDVLVDVYQINTISGVQSYTKVYSNVRVMLVPASQETIALYENAPVGQTYEYLIRSDALTQLKGQSKFKVVAEQRSGIAQNQEFITINDAQRMNMGGRITLAGVCYQTE